MFRDPFSHQVDESGIPFLFLQQSCDYHGLGLRQPDMRHLETTHSKEVPITIQVVIQRH